MRNWKKFMAAMMAATMVVGSTGVAYAADTQNTQGTGTATGGLEGTVTTDIFVVDVPTSATYTFKMDPEGLIAGTDGAAYDSGTVFEDGASVFFPNVVGDVTSYSSLSDAITITNKGTTYAKVTLEAYMEGLEVIADDGNKTITMSNTDTFSDTNAGLYLAVVDADETVTAITGTETAKTTAEAVIDAAPEGAYKLGYNSDSSKYEYTLKDDLTGIVFDTYTFQIKGACNTAADWSALATAAPKLSITWKVEQYTPTGTVATFAAGSDVGTITVTDGTDDMKIKEIVSVMMTNASGETYDGFVAVDGLWEAGTFESNTITLDTDFVKWYADLGACDATVTYKTTIGQTITEVVEDVLVAESTTP